MIIAVIGCGVMGSALAHYFAKHHTLIVCDQVSEKGRALAEKLNGTFYERINDAIQDADVIILAVKAKDLPSVSKQTGGSFSDGQLLISVLAGTSIARLKKHFPVARIERIMPNLPIIHGKGVVGIVDASHTTQEKKWLEKLLEGLGSLYWLQESQIEAMTSLIGDSPAFFTLFLEAMIESGVFMGFSAALSKELLMQALEGTLSLLKESDEHPALLREKIASPGGTSIAGIRAMEDSGVRSGIFEGFLVSYERGRQMLDEKH